MRPAGASPQLTAALEDPCLAWLVDRARQRIARGLPLTGRVSLRNATPAQREALERLLGRRAGTARGLSVALEDVDAIVRRAGWHSAGIRGALEEIGGEIIVTSEARARDAEAWRAAFAPLDAVVAGRPQLTGWCAELKRSGVVKRLCGDASESSGTLAVLARVISVLPLSRSEALAVFAAQIAGGAHGLDDGRPLATLALGAARVLGQVEPAGPGMSPAEDRREVWASVGVLSDAVSSTVLCLNLPTALGPSFASGALRGEPHWLTLRHLVRAWPADVDLTDRVISVCENPAVVSAASDRLGPSCPPLVCVAGQPSAAAMRLLESLVARGAQLRYHGDFDWAGIKIANLLYRRTRLTPWRLQAADYALAISAHHESPALVGDSVAALWDAQLAPEMRRAGRGIEEELLLAELLEDLSEVTVRDGAYNRASGLAARPWSTL